MSDHVSAHKTSVSSPSEYVRSVLSETISVEYDELDEETSLSNLGVDSPESDLPGKRCKYPSC